MRSPYQTPVSRRFASRVRLAPPRPPRFGPESDSGTDSPSDPMFEFTFETAIKKQTSGYRPEEYAQTKISVFAATEEAAKQKVTDALAPVPTGQYGTTYSRIFRFEGVREVT